MARLTRDEEELKAEALWIVYREFLAKGNDLPLKKEVREQANERDEVKACKTPIGEKTLIQSKNKRIIELNQIMDSNKSRVVEIKSLAPSELSIKIEQLHSSLQANAILSKKLENRDKRLENKDKLLNEKDDRIIELSKEIERLRNGCS